MTPPTPQKSISPHSALEQIANAIPADCREHIIVVGSLAAGYRYFGKSSGLQVRTKDADCLISPYVTAIDKGALMVERLIEEGWEYHPTNDFPHPGDEKTPNDKLPVARLRPKGSGDFFIELLTVPENSDMEGRDVVRLPTSRGHFGLARFAYLLLAEYKPLPTELGIRIARPEMMALSNLLHHPIIGSALMSGLIEGRKIKRSNKDLGRVIALAWLAENEKEDTLEQWAPEWVEALKNCFFPRWRDLGKQAGGGLRQILGDANQGDLEEAHHTCIYGLLSSKQPTLTVMKVTGERLLVDAIEALEEASNEADEPDALVTVQG